LTHQSLWQPTSGQSSPRRDTDRGGGRFEREGRQEQEEENERKRERSILFILSREPTAIPEVEARTLVGDLDSDATFESPGPGLLLAGTTADPRALEARVAFSRRVGLFVPDGEFDEEHLALLRSGTYRIRVFGASEGESEEEERALISSIARKVGGRVSLEEPDREVSAYVSAGRDGGGTGTYVAITMPLMMRQGWATRRPRSRAFFHPSAIFPKLSRALVNFSGVQPGERFLDPFCGTGSLLIEAAMIGADPVGADIARKMVGGARRNSLKYGQPWLGVVRADARMSPVRSVEAVATDIPYGRASSAGGLDSRDILRSLLCEACGTLKQGRKLVVMHQKSVEVGPLLREARRETDLSIEREVEIYVHRTLTRTISVLRRGDKEEKRRRRKG
jgi:tRNA (guanine10-N2)-dimethyltransferase